MQMARPQCDMTHPLLQMRHTSLLTMVLYNIEQFPVAFFCWFISVDKVIFNVVQSFEFHERKADCGFFQYFRIKEPPVMSNPFKTNSFHERSK